MFRFLFANINPEHSTNHQILVLKGKTKLLLAVVIKYWW